jgi:hypothetical protein
MSCLVLHSRGANNHAITRVLGRSLPYATGDVSNLILPADAMGRAVSNAVVVPNDVALLLAVPGAQFLCVDLAVDAVGIVMANGVRRVIGD